MQGGEERIRVLRFAVLDGRRQLKPLFAVRDCGLYRVDYQSVCLQLADAHKAVQPLRRIRGYIQRYAIDSIFFIAQIASEQVLLSRFELQSRVGQFAFQQRLVDITVFKLAHSHFRYLRTAISQALPSAARSKVQLQIARIDVCERTVRTRGQIKQHVLRNQQTRGRHKTEVAQFAACRHVAQVLRTLHRSAEIGPQREGIFNDAQPAEIHACQTHVHLCGISTIQFGRDASFSVDERVACFEVYHCVAAVECRAEADTAQRKTVISSFAHLGRRPKIGARSISIEAASFHTEFTRQRPEGLSFEELCQFKSLHIDLRRIALGVQVHRRASVYIPLTLLQGKVCAIVGAGEIHRTEQTYGIRHVEGTRRTFR